MKRLLADAECHDALEPRIGGSAYRWAYKLADDVIGEELQLVASLPAKFLGVEGGAEYVSVFSFYSRMTISWIA